MTVYEILEELNAENGSNYKMDVLRKHSDNELLKRVLKMTYDRATFTYGVTMKNVDIPPINPMPPANGTLEWALDVIEKEFVTRNTTGNEALYMINDILWNMHEEDRDVFTKVINRDLRINMGRSNINKVFKNLIVKPVYMRCGTYNEKSAKKINFPAYVQLKADGTYREFTLENGKVSCISRSGEEYSYPDIDEVLIEDGKDGVYHGELTVYDENGNLLDRATGNGIINSGDFDGYFLKLDVWDYITLEEYSKVRNKEKGTTPYWKRFQDLSVMFPRWEGQYRIEIIESHEVHSIKEAMNFVSHWMKNGYEGGILKDMDGIFRDGTSPHQLKLKLKIDAEVRIIGFIEGKPGTKREKTFGAIAFGTDDGKIKGSTSGFTDDQLLDFNSRREELIGQIMTVEFNDLTKGRDNDYYALSHPRFVELRPDRDSTDTLERVMQSKEMAMEMKK